MNTLRTTRRVLVVDDDAATREAIAEVLADLGYAPVGAPDGARAMEWLRKHGAPDLIFLDLRMPVMDGWALFIWIRGQSALDRVPIVIVSGTPIPRGGKELMNQGGPLWLEKPLDHDDIAGVMEAYFSTTG